MKTMILNPVQKNEVKGALSKVRTELAALRQRIGHHRDFDMPTGGAKALLSFTRDVRDEARRLADLAEIVGDEFVDRLREEEAGQ